MQEIAGNRRKLIVFSQLRMKIAENCGRIHPKKRDLEMIHLELKGITNQDPGF